jgi:hypothetical protein
VIPVHLIPSGDYANEYEWLTKTGLHPTLAQHQPQVRAAQMHAANQSLAEPVVLPPVSRPSFS